MERYQSIGVKGTDVEDRWYALNPGYELFI